MEKWFECVKLHFSSPLHLSRGRENFDESARVLHSDTIAAALFVAALHTGATDREALAMLDNCRLSSAFPFWQNTLFFPKPLVRLPFSLQDVAEEKQGKPFKKIRFLSQDWFEKLLRGEEADIFQVTHLQNKEFLSSGIGKHAIFKSQVNQRVTIPPDYSGHATPFYTERLFFEALAGLFVLVEWTGQGGQDLFTQSFRLLGDLGIGTDRSVGNGFFTPEFHSIELQLPDAATHQCALGLYLPETGELSGPDLEVSTWSLTKRGGYLAGAANEDHLTLRKRSIFMFEEGSVFPNRPLLGKREDLKPDWPSLHPVWREGRPIFLPIKMMPEQHEG